MGDPHSPNPPSRVCGMGVQARRRRDLSSRSFRGSVSRSAYASSLNLPTQSTFGYAFYNSMLFAWSAIGHLVACICEPHFTKTVLATPTQLLSPGCIIASTGSLLNGLITVAVCESCKSFSTTYALLHELNSCAGALTLLVSKAVWHCMHAFNHHSSRLLTTPDACAHSDIRAGRLLGTGIREGSSILSTMVNDGL